MQYVRQRRLPSLRLCSSGSGGPRFLWRLEPIPLRNLDLSRTNGTSVQLGVVLFSGTVNGDGDGDGEDSNVVADAKRMPAGVMEDGFRIGMGMGGS